MREHSSTVVKVMCYKSEGYWFDPSWCHDPGVDAASNRNEFQEHFLGVKAAGALRLTTYHHSVPLSRNLGTLTSWNPPGHSEHVKGLIYLYLLPAKYIPTDYSHIIVLFNTDLTHAVQNASLNKPRLNKLFTRKSGS